MGLFFIEVPLQNGAAAAWGGMEAYWLALLHFFKMCLFIWKKQDQL